MKISFKKIIDLFKSTKTESIKKPNLVVFTGAGISAESGIKTFRDSNGYWNDYKIEDVATPKALIENTELVFNFYNKRRQEIQEAEPNEAHFILADLEKNYNVTIITQNIDDFHERAGSTNVIHLHGSINEARSITDHNLVYILDKEEYFDINKKCPETDSILRPNIVFFGENIQHYDYCKSFLAEADYFIVIGTSLSVYPAVNLLDYVSKKSSKYLINPEVSQKIKMKYIDFCFIENTAVNGVKIINKKFLNTHNLLKSI